MSSFFDYPAVTTGSQRLATDETAILAGWDSRDWAQLRRHCTMERVRDGALVVRRGEADRSLFIVVTGTLAIDGAPRAPRMGPGQVFGEVSFFDGRPRSSSVVAVTECQLLRLTFDRFGEFAASAPRLARELLIDLGSALAGRLRAAESRGQ